MEQSELVDATLEVFREAAAAHPDTRLAIQACLRRTPSDLESLAPRSPASGWSRAPTPSRSSGRCGPRRRSPRSTGYLTDWLFAHGSLPAFGTHDDACIDYAKKAAATGGRRASATSKSRCCTASAGICSSSLAAGRLPGRVYIPFGSAWYPYLMRRMAERPANLLFFLRSLVGG